MNTIRLKQMSNKQKDIEYIIDENNCWNCISHCKDKDGYFLIRINYKIYGIHRLVYEEFNNIKIPKGMIIMYICDNPSCINPLHLKLGTSKDNAIDRENKNRGNHSKGGLHSNSKLTEKQVLKIKSLLKKELFKQKVIAKMFNIDPSVITNIKQCKTWKHVNNF